MKLLHISDLHIGKRLHGAPLAEDQSYIFSAILRVAERERPQAVLISGDIYDKSMPAAESVAAFDDFVISLHERGIQVFAISGNHDSPERLAFGARILSKGGVFFSRVYDGSVSTIPLADEYGALYVHLLPFVKPAYVRRFFPKADIPDYNAAVKTALSGVITTGGARHVLLAHQFVTGAARSESEELTIGGLDNVDASAFDGFDYVALGHLHNPQRVSRETIRYCGTPLAYSFSEQTHPKSVTVIDLRAKGDIEITTAPLVPLRALRTLKGPFETLAAPAYGAGTSLPQDFLHIILTDELDVPEAMGRLRAVYPNLLKLSYDNARTRAEGRAAHAYNIDAPPAPEDVFAAFYEQQNGTAMLPEQKALLHALVERLSEESREG